MTAPAKKLTTSAMIASFADPGQPTARAPFGHALARLAEDRPEIVGLTADLAKYTDMHVFRDAHPDRFFQMGMAEQVMLGAAAGMAEVGLIPFASTYSVFATRRAYDFLCLDIAEPGLNVNVARHTRADHRRPLRLSRHRAGGARAGGHPGSELPAAAARQRAHRAQRVRLPV
jgi:deoxyxylulose-5-phosphate synthase